MFYVVFPISLLPPIISTTVNYYIFDKGIDSFVMPIPMLYVLNITLKNEDFFYYNQCSLYLRLPSIWKSPVGYAIFYVYLTFNDIIEVLLVLPMVLCILGSGWLLKSFIEDIMNELAYLNVYDDLDGHEDEDNEPIEEHFCKTVKLYTNVKELCAIYY